MTGVEVLVAVVIAVGLVGVVVPLLPGALLAWSAIVVWGFTVGTATGWAVVGVATALIAAGQIVKYTIPGRGLRADGVPNRSLVVGGLVAIVGFFVVPVVGVFIGFVLGVYASELQRVGAGTAWPSTKAALRAVGISMLLELTSTLLAHGQPAAGTVEHLGHRGCWSASRVTTASTVISAQPDPLQPSGCRSAVSDVVGAAASV